MYAAADGYVSYVGVRPLSFGKFIIIRHPNGYSTLYAHLNSFYPELEEYVGKKQAETESWTQELRLPENLFPVKKGSQLAWSGNTGGSQGPHLHFEILNTKTGHSLNPLLFGFDITDTIPPDIYRVGIYNRDRSTYLQEPSMFNVVKKDSSYFIKPRKILIGNKKLSLAIEAIDKIKKGTGTEGIYRADLYFDGQPVIQYMVDDMDYNESDYVNAHVDRRLKNSGGPYLQHLSLLPGYRGPVYKNIRGNGILELKDTLEHSVKIKVFDAYENYSELFLEIQYNPALAGKIKDTVYSKYLLPGYVNVQEEKDFEIFMPEDCLYDTVPLIYYTHNIFSPGFISALHHFGDPVYPVHTSFTVRIKPQMKIPEALKNKIVIVRVREDEKSVRKAIWQKDVTDNKGWLTASFAGFGNFQAFVDTSAPVIKAPAKEKDTLDFSPLEKIVFTPTDNSGIQSFRAELDGKWLMFSNDKTRDYVYIFDEQCPYGLHELKVKVKDLVGNETERVWWFKRYPYTPPPKKSYKKKTVTKKPLPKNK